MVLTLASVMASGVPVAPVPLMKTPAPLLLVTLPPVMVKVPVWPLDSRPTPDVAVSCRLLNDTAPLLLSTRTPSVVDPVTVVVPVALVAPVLLWISMPVAELLTVRLASVFVPVLGVLTTFTPVDPPVTVELLRLNAPALFVTFTPVPAVIVTWAFVSETFAVEAELVTSTPSAPGSVTFILFSATVPLSPVIATPAAVVLLIVPPLPAVLPLPVTVNEPPALFSEIPLVPPAALTLASVTASGAAVVAELSTETPVPAAAETEPALIVSVPV